MTHGGNRRVDVHGLARVEGEGSLHVHVHDGEVTEVELEIFEPPRYFEALLEGRAFTEAPDITARICGICPVAYQMSACAAMEDACGVRVGPGIERLRRLLYCGEWMQSHALHIHLLHAPDFFGLPDAVALAGHDRASVQRGLRIKQAANRLMEAVGGRAIHPVNVKVGGFYRSPDPATLTALADALRQARDDALTTVEWVAGFDIPEVTRDYRFVALRPDEGYPIEGGTVTTSDGEALQPAEAEARIVEEHVARSTALHARLDGRHPYLTGPLARYALNSDRLTGAAAEAARRAQLGATVTNPFKSIVVRAVELVYAAQEALALIADYEPPDPPAIDVSGREGTGTGVTEAPRGMLLHRYDLGPGGVIRKARIVPPTSQNQLSIEADLRTVVEGGLDLAPDQLTARCEQAVRNHDPCISCAAHFLDVDVVRV